MVKPVANRWIPLLLFVAFVYCFTGCNSSGSSGESAQAHAPSLLDGHFVCWRAPATYTNQTPINLNTDIDRYELFINECGVFGSNDQPAAHIKAINKDGSPAESLNLGLLTYPFVEGHTYYFSMRTVTKAGIASGFSRTFFYTIR